jgi:serine/threonine protein kinase
MSDRDLLASQEFITFFYVATHVNLSQRLILWCLERNPANRPTAKMLLTSGLMPRKVELEQRYLDEVLQTLSDPQSEQSYQSILAKLFQRPNPKVRFTISLRLFQSLVHLSLIVINYFSVHSMC